VPEFWVYEARGGLPYQRHARSMRALCESSPPLTSVSVWCEERAHLHWPDGQWHVADELLRETQAELLRGGG
jgi:hypothetical protein